MFVIGLIVGMIFVHLIYKVETKLTYEIYDERINFWHKRALAYLELAYKKSKIETKDPGDWWKETDNES